MRAVQAAAATHFFKCWTFASATSPTSCCSQGANGRGRPYSGRLIILMSSRGLKRPTSGIISIIQIFRCRCLPSDVRHFYMHAHTHNVRYAYCTTNIMLLSVASTETQYSQRIYIYSTLVMDKQGRNHSKVTVVSTYMYQAPSRPSSCRIFHVPGLGIRLPFYFNVGFETGLECLRIGCLLGTRIPTWDIMNVGYTSLVLQGVLRT